MDIKTVTTYTLSLDGSPEWQVTSDDVKTIEDEQFVRFAPRDLPLIKLVVHGVDGLPKILSKDRPTLSNIDGYKLLLNARNALQAKEFEPDNAGLMALFGPIVSSQSTPKKHKKHKVESDVNAVFDVPLPDDERVCVRMIRAKHPSDVMYMSFGTIDHAILFMRRCGITPDTVLGHRSYKSSIEIPEDIEASESGTKSLVVRNGTRGFLVNFVDGPKRCKTLARVISCMSKHAEGHDDDNHDVVNTNQNDDEHQDMVDSPNEWD